MINKDKVTLLMSLSYSFSIHIYHSVTHLYVDQIKIIDMEFSKYASLKAHGTCILC